MTHIVVKREFPLPMQREDIAHLLEVSSGCLGDWGIDWVGSYQGFDLKTSLCHYEAVDMDSVKFALRQLQPEQEYQIWQVSNHLGENELPINVVVERAFKDPCEVAEIQAQEDKNIHCLELYGVKFVKTYFSRDKKFMVCLYNAPDAESVKQAQLKAELPFADIWPCKEWQPEDFE